jgi:homocysteine S-methyltransferase
VSGLAVAARLRERSGLDVILHCSSRDRNLLALQADLLGAHALGVRNVLALTGDPLQIGQYPHAAGVWDVDAVGLIEILTRMNRGEDWAGSPLAEPTAFHVGCAVGLPDDTAESERLQRKLDAGAHFVLAPPLFDAEQLDALLDRLGPLPVPLLVGVLPLQNSRHAEFFHNEVPGMAVPAVVRERLHAAGDEGAAEGLRLAAAFLAAARQSVAGAYLVSPNGLAEAVATLLDDPRRPSKAKRG